MNKLTNSQLEYQKERLRPKSALPMQTEKSSIFNPNLKANNLEKTFDTSSYSSAGSYAFQSVAPNASTEVRDAWRAAAEATGTNSFSDSDSFLSSLYAMQSEQKAQTGSTDVLGSTKESAVTAIKRAIRRLDGLGDERVSTKTKEYKAKEKAFYQELLTQLG